jgi:hypothetical protein
MSRGYGRIQREIISTFTSNPGKRFTHEALARIVYPGVEIEKHHTDAINRAVLKIAPVLGLERVRAGAAKSRGWHATWYLPGGQNYVSDFRSLISSFGAGSETRSDT